MSSITKCWLHAQIATMNNPSDIGLIADGAIVTRDKKIIYLGPTQNLPTNITYDESIDCKGTLITPILVDCHTHVVYAGNRANEFEQRLNGLSYADIAKQGGGIRATVKATRAASEVELFEQSAARVAKMVANGTRVLEIKSGYGLNLSTELKILRVAQQLGEKFNIAISATFLGAHAVPEEYQGKSDDYIDIVCREMIPEVAKLKLATSVDAFCEGIAFSVAQVEKVFQTATEHGLKIKIHAEQLSNLGATQLAAEYKALSSDHLEHISAEGVKAMAAAGTVAVLLPGAFYFLKETQKPPVDLLRKHHVPIAIATDCNPGSSPTTSLPLMMNMACTLFGLTVTEALQAVTVNAAKALGLNTANTIIQLNGPANFVRWTHRSVAELVSNF